MRSQAFHGKMGCCAFFRAAMAHAFLQYVRRRRLRRSIVYYVRVLSKVCFVLIAVFSCGVLTLLSVLDRQSYSGTHGVTFTIGFIVKHANIRLVHTSDLSLLWARGQFFLQDNQYWNPQEEKKVSGTNAIRLSCNILLYHRFGVLVSRAVHQVIRLDPSFDHARVPAAGTHRIDDEIDDFLPLRRRALRA